MYLMVYKIYLCRYGELEYNVMGCLGGNFGIIVKGVVFLEIFSRFALEKICGMERRDDDGDDGEGWWCEILCMV